MRIPVSLGFLFFSHVGCYLSTLNGIIGKIQNLQRLPRFKRAWSFIKDSEKIVGMRKEFDDVLGLFQVRINRFLS